MTAPPFAKARGRCPICGRPSVPDYRPFCSRRCADVDLARWLSDAYAIPGRGESDARTAGGKPAENGEAETGSDSSR